MRATIHPLARVSGTVRVPGDKSISHRLAMLASWASGTTRLRGFLRSGDCLSTVKAVAAFGAEIAWVGEELQIRGGPWRRPNQPLDLGNSGTSMRLLAGLLAGRPWITELTGDASLCSRPMGRIKDPLERMGARIELRGPKNCAPLRIHGGQLRGIDYVMPVASAQVKSCILLAGLFADGTTTVQEPLPTRDHTERLFQVLGLPLAVEGRRISIRGFGPEGPSLPARSWEVPGDFSSAAFWLVAGAAVPGATVQIQNVGLNPRRTALVDVLRRMGADVQVAEAPAALCPEPCGAITVRGARLTGAEVGGAEIPNLIDELPLVAVAGALARGVTTIRDARELRVKESDRIAAIAVNLRALGVTVDEKEDGMVVAGGAPIRVAQSLDSFGDHRIAMAMAVLALSAAGPVVIDNVACVDTSYPDFWNHLTGLGAHVELHRGN